MHGCVSTGSNALQSLLPWTNIRDINVELGLADELVEAHGCWVESRRGERLLDGSAGLWNVNLGHGRLEIVERISRSLAELSFASRISQPSARVEKLSKRLLANSPENLNSVMYHCTGTAGVEAAIVLVRQYFKRIGQPGRRGIISLNGGFHGSSMLMTAVSGLADDKDGFMPLPGCIHHIDAPLTPSASEESIHQLCQLVESFDPHYFQCLVVEPVMGVEGGFALPLTWLRQVREICDHYGIKIIADEVASGVGRTGRWIASPQDLKIDVLVLGKGLSAGYIPIAVSLYDEQISEGLFFSGGPDIKYGSTMDASPAACACAEAVLDIMDRESVVENVVREGEYLRRKLEELEELPCVQSVRGVGLMIGLKLGDHNVPGKSLSKHKLRKVSNSVRRNGVLLDCEGESALLIYPPLVINRSESDFLVSALERALADVK